MPAHKRFAFLCFLLAALIYYWPADMAPGPSPGPAPIPGDGLSVLIVEETADRQDLPESQLQIMASVELREWFSANNAVYRIWDKDVDHSRDDQAWGHAMRQERASLPWLYVSNGTRGYSGPLPSSVRDTIQLLEKYK